MEALYLDCGRRRPQLKRNPLGGNPLTPSLRLATARYRCSVLPAAVLAAACSHHAPPVARAPLKAGLVQGCYALTWNHGDSLLTGRWIPDLVRLDTTHACSSCTLDAPAAKYLAISSPLPDTASNAQGAPIPWYRLYYASHWLVLQPDTVHVFFNSNYTHWDAKLVQDDTILRGSAHYWSDGGRLDTLASVTARRAPCPP
jgi:hypothetical protein